MVIRFSFSGVYGPPLGKKFIVSQIIFINEIPLEKMCINCRKREGEREREIVFVSISGFR